MGFAGGQLEWQPALAVSNDCAGTLVQQQPHSSLHPPLSSKVQGGLPLHLKGPSMLSWAMACADFNAEMQQGT